MPSHKSAEKSVRRTVRRTQINKSRKNRIRTFVRKVEDMISSFVKNPAATESDIRAALVAAEKELMRGVSKGVMHKNAAARKVSRMNGKARKVVNEKAALSL
ncbi:MAG: 30S ribosomal protein S20 [Holosporales bacterium]|jgi:small subunit ribosomal protein S20|nr:30S ribosomal protein S20 [Holosporales bacterium]